MHSLDHALTTVVCGLKARVTQHLRWARSLALSLVATLLLPCGAQAADPYPSRPVSFIVPFAVGSSTDIMTRLMVKGLNDRLNTTSFIVEDKPGANGMVGSGIVAKARPDGHTLLVATGTTHAQNPWLYKNLGYDPIADFEPVAGIGGPPLILLVSKDLPAKTFPELIAYIKATPGKYSYGTPFGLSTVCSENIKKATGIDINQVPYKSSPQAITELIGGQILLLCTDLNSSIGAIRSGQVRAVAVTTETRTPQLPDVPAITEYLPGFPAMRSWVAVVAPKGTPAEIVELLTKNILAVTSSAEFLRALEPNGFERLGVGGADLQAYILAELAKSKKLIQDAGIEPQ